MKHYTERTMRAIKRAHGKGVAAGRVEKTHSGAYRNPYSAPHLMAAWLRGWHIGKES